MPVAFDDSNLNQILGTTDNGLRIFTFHKELQFARVDHFDCKTLGKSHIRKARKRC